VRLKTKNPKTGIVSGLSIHHFFCSVVSHFYTLLKLGFLFLVIEVAANFTGERVSCEISAFLFFTEEATVSLSIFRPHFFPSPYDRTANRTHQEKSTQFVFFLLSHEGLYIHKELIHLVRRQKWRIIISNCLLVFTFLAFA